MSPQIAQQWLAGYAQYDMALLLPAILVCWLYRRRVGGWPPQRPGAAGWALQFALGAGLGVAAIAVSVAPAWLAGGYRPGPGWLPFGYAFSASVDAGRLWLMFAAQSLFEELLFRAIGVLLLGMLLYWLARFALLPTALRGAPGTDLALRWQRGAWLYCGVAATLTVAAAFAAVHSANAGVSSLALANIALAGVALGLICWLQGSPLGAWGLHLVWNALMASLGLPVSGISLGPPAFGIGCTGARPGLLTGGAFGPEASLPATVAMLLVIAYLLWRMRRSAQPPASP